MLWHIVRFEFPDDVDATVRAELEAELAGLEAIEEVCVLRVARDVDVPRVTGLITAFDHGDALARYRDHPLHVPVVEHARQVCSSIIRLDVATDDDPSALPRTA